MENLTTTQRVNEAFLLKNLETGVDNKQVNSWYEISEGNKSMMYTLWRCRIGLKNNSRIFVQNLSINKEEALQKAKEIACGVEVVDMSEDELSKIYRSKPDQINFGKHKGTKIVDLPDGYLLWVSNGALIEVEAYSEKHWNGGTNVHAYTKNLVEDDQKKIAFDEAIKRGLYILYEGKYVSKKFAEYLEKQKLGFGHHYQDKEKVELEVTLIKESSYDSPFGGKTYIQTFQDKEGRKFQYKGDRYICLPWTEEEYLEYWKCTREVALAEGHSERTKAAEVGDSFKIKGTVKLGEYNGNKITYLQRIKVIG